LLYTNISVVKMTKGMFIAFELTPRIMATGFFVAAVLGIIASIMPTRSVAKMSVVDGLKTLD
jgi:ABC-type antimicrobial peptide transport system permease subunit